MRSKLMQSKPAVQKMCGDTELDDLFGLLAKVPNILSGRGRRLIPDARDIAHYGDVLKGIWWYALPTREMRYSSKALSHMDEEFDGVVSPFSKQWVRGRVGDDRGKLYAFLYKCDFKSSVIPGKVAGDMLQKLRERSGLKIGYFVDEKGYSLV